MQTERKVSPYLSRQKSEMNVSPNSSSSRKKSESYKKQHTLIVEKTTPFDELMDVKEEGYYVNTAVRSLTELLALQLPPMSSKSKNKDIIGSDQSKYRKRKSHKDVAVNNLRSFQTNREANENIVEFDKPKTNEDFTLILDVLKSHFIFFFSNLLSCRH